MSGVAAALFAAAPLAFGLAAGISSPALARSKAAVAAVPAQPRAYGLSITDFYASRGDYPLWLAPAAGGAAQDLVALLQSAKKIGRASL